MKQLFILILFTCKVLNVKAQKYAPVTKETDSFSISFVRLLTCAAERFESCKGEWLRSTSLMGDDYKLTIPFPKSVIGIVRIRNWDKNAYVEFRGFKNEAETKAGLQSLIDNIKKTLGDQFYSSTTSFTSLSQFYSFAIKDATGYFSPNIELFAGSSAAVPYLLGPEKDEEAKREKKQFILLKIYAGIPSYQYYIRQTVKVADVALHQAMKEIFRLAEHDFDSLKNEPGFLPKKKNQQLLINGFETNFNFRGSNYFASLSFPIPADTLEKKNNWNYYQIAIQALLGNEYVYHVYSLQEGDYVTYYAMKNGDEKPTVRLETFETNGQQFYAVKIISPVGHPTKRSWSFAEE